MRVCGTPLGRDLDPNSALWTRWRADINQPANRRPGAAKFSWRRPAARGPKTRGVIKNNKQWFFARWLTGGSQDARKGRAIWFNKDSATCTNPGSQGPEFGSIRKALTKRLHQEHTEQLIARPVTRLNERR
jgi:hypothetical protein